MRRNRFFWCLVLTYVVGLSCLAVYFRNALNADAVAYLRLASYYARGEWTLAVSGYWGPLASWLMAVFLKLGLPPLAVARGFMVFSALAFLWGCIAVYRAFHLPERWLLTGAALSAAAGLYWSVQFITPDLLLSGLIGVAVARMIGVGGFRTGSASVSAGMVWGLAYLTKAIAFPLAILTWLAFGALSLRNKSMPRSILFPNLAVTLLVFGLVAAPWVLTLSLTYRTPTFSTTPWISHTLTGPPDAERYHPFGRTLHRPELGRVTSWEEPSRMAYNEWSPLDSWAYTWHQLKVLAGNLSTCLLLLTSLNVSWLVLVFPFVLRRLRRGGSQAAEAGWERALIVPALLVLLYLPCYVTLTEQRFFYAAFPFLFAALALWVLESNTGLRPGPIPGATLSVPGEPVPPGISNVEARGWWLAVLGAAAPLLTAVLVISASPRIAGDIAADLARRIQRSNLAGPVAGSGMLPGGRAGLYVAYLLDQPWYGDEPHAHPASLKASGARLVIALRRSELAAVLDRDGAFADLDQRLFADPAEAAQFPLKAFEITRPSAVPNP